MAENNSTLSKIWDWTKGSGKKTGDFLSNNTGTVAGLGQLITGLIVADQSKAPESNISDQLKNLSREVRQRAAYGLDPGEKTIAENNIKNIQQNEIALIKDLSGGSVDVALANIGRSTKRTHDALSTLAIKDAELKEQKQLSADNIALRAIEADEREYEKSYNKYLQNENAVSNLIGAGISNIVGESKLKKTNEQLREEVDNNNNVTAWKSILGIKDKADASIEKAEDAKDVIKEEVINPSVYDIIEDKTTIPFT